MPEVTREWKPGEHHTFCPARVSDDAPCSCPVESSAARDLLPNHMRVREDVVGGEIHCIDEEAGTVAMVYGDLKGQPATVVHSIHCAGYRGSGQPFDETACDCMAQCDICGEMRALTTDNTDGAAFVCFSCKAKIEDTFNVEPECDCPGPTMPEQMTMTIRCSSCGHMQPAESFKGGRCFDCWALYGDPTAPKPEGVIQAKTGKPLATLPTKMRLWVGDEEVEYIRADLIEGLMLAAHVVISVHTNGNIAGPGDSGAINDLREKMNTLKGAVDG